MLSTPYSSNVMTSCRITSFKPGHKPPQVTIAAFTACGSKKMVSRGPARMALRWVKQNVSLVLGVYWTMYGQKVIGPNSHQR
jgi:hypothetical protein|tara:strand:+ start:21534 stop:21779 length:246 start_codon:yes stop_codon:yes gene_type:complete